MLTDTAKSVLMYLLQGLAETLSAFIYPPPPLTPLPLLQFSDTHPPLQSKPCILFTWACIVKMKSNLKTLPILRGGFRISGKGVHMNKGEGVRFADFIISHENEDQIIGLRPNNFIFEGYLKMGGGGGGGFKRTP